MLRCRQAFGLRMAYRVRYPNLLCLLYFLMIAFPNILILPDNPGVPSASPPPGPHRGPVQRLQASKTPQDASKMPPRWAQRRQDKSTRYQDASKRPQDASKTAQEASKTAPRSSKTVFLSQHGPMLAPTWSHVGTKIAFRRYLMLKQPES